MKILQYSKAGAVRHIFPDRVVPKTSSRYEQELHLRLLNQVSNAADNGGLLLFGEIDTKYLEDRFLGTAEAISEKPIDNFPDFTLVKETLIIIMDHFRIDASPQLHKNGKSHGTSYQNLAGSMRLDNHSIEESESIISNQNCEFSSKNLALNLRRTFESKASKIPKYKKRIIDHIKDISEPNGAINDLRKPKEIWFVVEDVSPSCGFSFIGAPIAILLEHNPEVDGLIYIHNPIPGQLTFSWNSVAIIRNDAAALASLRNMNGEISE